MQRCFQANIVLPRLIGIIIIISSTGPHCAGFACVRSWPGPRLGKRELIALLNLSSWCLVMVERLFLAVPRGCLQFVIVVFPDHTHLLFFMEIDHEIISMVILLLTTSL